MLSISHQYQSVIDDIYSGYIDFNIKIKELCICLGAFFSSKDYNFVRLMRFEYRVFYECWKFIRLTGFELK